MSYTNQQIAKLIAQNLAKNKQPIFQKGYTTSTGINRQINVSVGGKVVRALGWNVDTPGEVNVFWDAQNKRYVAWKEDTRSLKRKVVLAKRKVRPDDKKITYIYPFKILTKYNSEWYVWGFNNETKIDLPSGVIISSFSNNPELFTLFAYTTNSDELTIYKQSGNDPYIIENRTINKDFFTNKIIPSFSRGDNNLTYLFTQQSNPTLVYTDNNPKPQDTAAYRVYQNPFYNFFSNKKHNLGTIYISSVPGQTAPIPYFIDRLGNADLSGTHPAWPYNEYAFDLRTTVSSSGSGNVDVTIHPNDTTNSVYISSGQNSWNHTVTQGSTSLYDGSLIVYGAADPMLSYNYSSTITSSTNLENEGSFIVIDKDQNTKITFPTVRNATFNQNIDWVYDDQSLNQNYNGIDNFTHTTNGTENRNFTEIETYNFQQDFTFNFEGITLELKNTINSTKNHSYTLSRDYNKNTETFGDGYRTWYGWWYYSTSEYNEVNSQTQGYTDITNSVENYKTPYIQINKELLKYVFVSQHNKNINMTVSEDSATYINNLWDQDIYNVPGRTREDNQYQSSYVVVKDIDYVYTTRTHTGILKIDQIILNLTDSMVGYYITKIDASLAASIHNAFTVQSTPLSLSLSSINFVCGVDISNTYNHLTLQPAENVTRLRRRVDYNASINGFDSYSEDTTTTINQDTNVVTIEKTNNPLSTYSFIASGCVVLCKYQDNYYKCAGTVNTKTTTTTPDFFETVATTSKSELNVSYKTAKKVIAGVSLTINTIEKVPYNAFIENSDNQLIVVPKDNYTRIILNALYNAQSNVNLYKNNDTVYCAFAQIVTNDIVNSKSEKELYYADVYKWDSVNNKFVFDSVQSGNITPFSSSTYAPTNYHSFNPNNAINVRKKK